MNQPISVAMAVYNGQAHLHEQLSTLLADLGDLDEVIIVDDGSSDGSATTLQAWQLQDPRVRLILQTQNKGVRSSFERAIEAALHDIVFLCDQDDVWMPGKRDALVACFDKDPRCLLALSDAQVIDADGRTVADSFMQRRGGFRGGLLSTLVRNRYLGCTMALHRRLVRLAVPVPISAPMHDMWFGAMASLWGNVAYVDRPLIQYRRHGGNVTPDRHRSIYQMLIWRLQLTWCVIARSMRVLRLRAFGMADDTFAPRKPS